MENLTEKEAEIVDIKTELSNRSDGGVVNHKCLIGHLCTNKKWNPFFLIEFVKKSKIAKKGVVTRE